MRTALLAIESSQRTCSVAIRNRAGEILQRTATGDPRERDVLLPAIIELLAEAGRQASDLNAVAVSTGPGGFTGLRVSIATAKGMCEALGIPAIDVPSALVAAMGLHSQWTPHSNSVFVALAVKGDECWMTEIEVNSKGDICVRLAQSIGADAFDCGNARHLIADDHLSSAIRCKAIESGLSILPPVFHASDCLLLAESQRDRSEVVDATDLRVRYPREPEAVTVWRARYPEGFRPKK